MNPFRKDTLNVTAQMLIFRRSPEEARRLQAEAAEAEKQHDAPTVSSRNIASALAAEVRRTAAFGGIDDGALHALSRNMGADDETHGAAMAILLTVAGRRGNGRWMPHVFVGEGCRNV